MTQTYWGQKRRASDNAEASFQRVVEDLAAACGWYTFHIYNPSRSKKGTPDLICFRERIVWLELKARSRLTGRMGKLMPEQMMWRDMIHDAGGEWYCFNDEELQDVAVVLARPGQTARAV